MDRFDEYKFFAENARYLSERRHTATQTYITMNAAIFTVIAFLIKDAGLSASAILFATLPLFIVGSLVCWIWYVYIKRHGEVISWHYKKLVEMEQSIPTSYQIYLKEWEEFFKPRDGRRKFSFSRLELWLPKLFLALYIACMIGILYGKLIAT